MTSTAQTPEEYIASLPDDRKPAMQKLRDTIAKNLPKGFSEQMSYGGLGFVVPHSKYPAGYHCDPKLPLPFMGIGFAKKFYWALPHGYLCHARFTEMVYH